MPVKIQMIHGINVTYGPGNPAGRWFDSIGGTINFVPLQPSVKPSAEMGTSFGSNGTLGYNFDLKTGMYDGWSAVLAGGYTKNNTFRTGAPFMVTWFPAFGLNELYVAIWF